MSTSNSSSSASPTTLVIGGPLAQTRFDVCWLEPLSGGQQWSKLMGCALIIYSWSFSQRKSLWTVLLAHAIGGFFGTLIENIWVAGANCRYFVPQQDAPYYAWLLLFNEINWIPHESTVILYSYIKTRIVLRNKTIENVVNYFLIAMFIFYVGCRINIGRLRYQHNILMDEDIALAHNYVYIIWILADAVLMVLLFWNVIDHLQKSNALATQTTSVVKTLLNSSLPRFSVILFNTAVIAVLNFVMRNPNLDAGTTLTLKNFSKFTSMVKGAYPTLLLLDILMTRFLLYAKQSEHTSDASTSQRTASNAHGGPGGPGYPGQHGSQGSMVPMKPMAGQQQQQQLQHLPPQSPYSPTTKSHSSSGQTQFSASPTPSQQPSAYSNAVATGGGYGAGGYGAGGSGGVAYGNAGYGGGAGYATQLGSNEQYGRQQYSNQPYSTQRQTNF
ncbi:hypothetical protein DFJ73DRAFT_803268 [Zopfochytrium polystomum]|nr:hypothetical protein DFJ73DRAFT_803268 [Zopfochytrium polystomum]